MRLRHPAALCAVAMIGAAIAVRGQAPAAPAPGFDLSGYWTAAMHEDALERGAGVPPAYDRAKELADRIEARRAGATPRPCHNDLLNANFIADGEHLWIVDWEYAGMGDPFFDLGNFAVNHELDEEGEHALLAAYGSDDHDALVLMRFMSDFREAMWGVVQQALSELDFDFVDYADQHFGRLERIAAEPRFREALQATKAQPFQ